MNEVKLSKDFLVTLHNDLVQARFSDSLTINEQKILFAVLSNIEPPQFDINEEGKRVIKEPVKEIEPFKVPIKEFTEWLGFKDPNYAAFKNTVKKLMKKLIEIQQPDGSWEVFQWVTKSSYIAKEGIAEIKLSPELYPYLLNLEKNFTTTKLNILLSFKSVYSSRLYQLIKKWEKIGSWKVEVDELKNLLGVPILKEVNGEKVFRLAQYGHFKKRALDVALKEINEYSEFDVTMNEHKTVRKITSLSFDIKRKSKKSKETPEKPKEKKNDYKNVKSYAFDFKEQYEEKSRKYYNRLTKKMVYFDGEERIKAILLNNIFDGISDDACYKIEELLLQIINIPSFDISREIHFLFGYTKNAKTIKQPELFIISKIKQLVDLMLQGNITTKFKDLIKIQGNFQQEVLPDWWFEGEKSKKEIERKKQIEFELTKLDDSKITFSQVELLQLLISIKNKPNADDETVEKNMDEDMKEDYLEYKRLKDLGVLDKLMESKKEELESLGYLDSNGKLLEKVVTEIYHDELERTA